MTTSLNPKANVPLRMGSGRPSDPKKDKSSGSRPADPNKEGNADSDLDDDPDSQVVGRPADPKKKPSIIIGGGRPADPEKPPEK